MKRVFIPGVFDVFHVGHLNYLKSAAEAGDHLIVGVQDDRFVLRINPIIPLADRIAVLEALQCVDEVVSYTNVFQGPLLEGLEIDVFAVGEEYGQNEEYPDQKRTLEYCKTHDVEVFQIPRTHHVSSTNVRGHLKQFWNARARLQDELSSGVTVLGSFQGDQEKVGKETQIEVETILQAAGDPSSKSLLDLGCGDGRQLDQLGSHFGRVVGVDFATSLLELAKQRLEASGNSAELVEADVSEYTTEDRFDVLLLSGITPCLDDLQMEKMATNLETMAKPNSKLLVRTSIGLEERIDVVSQFSQDLKERYTAYYRTTEEIQETFRKQGWTSVKDNLLYQHREDTAVWWFEFERAA